MDFEPCGEKFTQVTDAKRRRKNYVWLRECVRDMEREREREKEREF